MVPVVVDGKGVEEQILGDQAVDRQGADLLEDVPQRDLIFGAQILAKEFGGPIEVLPWQHRHDAIDGVVMLVNATSQGMIGQAALDLRLDKLPQAALVNDIIYIPRETPLIEAARKRGNRTVTGLGMLLHQGIPAWKAWFGIEPKVTAELRAKIEATL